MRRVVLDTDVASRTLKDRLTGPLATNLIGTTWCVTFVTDLATFVVCAETNMPKIDRD